MAARCSAIVLAMFIHKCHVCAFFTVFSITPVCAVGHIVDMFATSWQWLFQSRPKHSISVHAYSEQQ